MFFVIVPTLYYSFLSVFLGNLEMPYLQSIPTPLSQLYDQIIETEIFWFKALATWAKREIEFHLVGIINNYDEPRNMPL